MERVHRCAIPTGFPHFLLGSDIYSALLPSSFAMYTTMFALSHAFIPPSNKDGHRTLTTVLLFTVGAVLGWPFALAIAVPFVFEELFVFGADTVPEKDRSGWQLNRAIRLLLCGAVAALTPVGTQFFCFRLSLKMHRYLLSSLILSSMERRLRYFGTL